VQATAAIFQQYDVHFAELTREKLHEWLTIITEQQITAYINTLEQSFLKPYE
jgi:hypothetical protein